MDQIANMLISIKNAGLVKKDHIFVPHSKIKVAILEVLKKDNLIKTFDIVETGVNKKEIKIVINYQGMHPHIFPKINDVQRISKLSRRVYFHVKDIKPIKYGHGLLVLSTPKGIMTGKQARKEMVGGEVLFKIW